MIFVFIENTPNASGPLYHILGLNAYKKYLKLHIMAEIKQQIFNELASLEEAAARLRGTAVAADKQTDLEVAILTEQVKNLREKNVRATEMIDKSINILKKLKK